MPKCPACHRNTVTGLRADGSVVALDPNHQTYVFVEDAALVIAPQDGGRVLHSLALVVHDSVCVAAIRQRDAQRRAARARQPQGAA